VPSNRDGGPLVMLFLGSNIGNFDRVAADALLRQIRETLIPGDALLLGADLTKPPHDLLLAYDDPLQVTAAFNRNILRRINDELGGTFELDGFVHRACWNARERRVEMHLVSTRRQVVRVAATDLEFELESGESIWTESSYKYEADEILAAGAAAGFGRGDQWIDEAARFALTRFAV
jgi:L-histidine N-alpha-methyltransferase